MMIENKDTAKPVVFSYSDVEKLIISEWIPELHKKFIEKYPDTFVCSTTTDEQIFKNCNPNMYSWYMLFCNSLYSIPSTHGKYKRTHAEESHSDYSRFKTMFEDFKNAEDWLGFLIQYVKVK
jgi:hypothetical protein